MNKETLRMQMLAGLITESEYKARLLEGTAPRWSVFSNLEDDDYYISNESDEFENVYTVKRERGGFAKSFPTYKQASEWVKKVRQDLEDQKNEKKENLKKTFKTFKEDFKNVALYADISLDNDDVITIYLDNDYNHEKNLIDKLVREKYSNSLKGIRPEKSEKGIMRFKIIE